MSTMAIDPATEGTINRIAVEIGRRQRRRWLAILVMAAAAAAAVTAGLSLGAVGIPFVEVWSILSRVHAPADAVHAMVVMDLRLPRVTTGLLIGASLALSGAALQGLMRNPLADPGLVGVASGAALGAVAVIVFASAWLAGWPGPVQRIALPLAAFGGGLATTLLIYRLAHRGSHTDIALLLLAGIAVNAVVGAVIGFAVFVSNDQQLRDLQFWMLGSLSGISRDGLLPPLAMMAVSVLGLWRLAGLLNGLSLGERDAHYLGFDTERCKCILVLLIALGVGAGVAVAGAIGFVGLIVPHLVRVVLGTDHRFVMPASALLGGALLVCADTVARLVVLPAELPIGIITSAIGGPFFLMLLIRHRRELAF